MKKEILMSLFLFILAISLFIGALVIADVQEDCYKTEKALCVDGDGDINLEGIMCEKQVYVCEDGNEDLRNGVIFFFLLLGVIFFFMALAMFSLNVLDGGRKYKHRKKKIKYGAKK